MLGLDPHVSCRDDLVQELNTILAAAVRHVAPRDADTGISTRMLLSVASGGPDEHQPDRQRNDTVRQYRGRRGYPIAISLARAADHGSHVDRVSGRPDRVHNEPAAGQELRQRHWIK